MTITIFDNILRAVNNDIRYLPGTLYNLLEQFQSTGMIRETKVEGRKRSYLITGAGQTALDEEYRRLRLLAADYEALTGREGLL